ncbi:MAG: hypothetical protein ACOYMA_04780 [Bacteroidia bacterium]
MKKLIITFLYCLVLISHGFAQRNPNTNAGKINKNPNKDTIQNNQVQKQPSDNPFENQSENKVQLGAYLNYGNSANYSKVLENGIGFGFKIGGNLLNKNMPISLYTGLGFDYLYFGGKKITQSNNVNVAINSNAYGWYPYLDLELGPSWPITFFGTAYWGGRFFYTRQNINYLDANNQSKTDTKNLEANVTQIYGIGGGIKIKISDGLKIEFKYQKNYGNILNVVDPNTIQFDSFGNLASYQNQTTDTDLEMLFVGILFCL